MAMDRTLIEPRWKAFYECCVRSPLAGAAGAIPGSSTCGRRLQMQGKEDIWLEICQLLLSTLDERRQLDCGEAFANATFAATKRRSGMGIPALAGGARETEWGKARNAWWWSPAKAFLWESIWPQRPRTRVTLL